MDNLKQLSIQLNGKIKSQENYNSNFKDKSFRILIINNYKNYKIHIDEYGSLYLIQIKLLSDFTLSINNPNALSSIDRLIKIEDSIYNVYIFKEDYSAFIKGHRYNPFISEDFQTFWGKFNNCIKKWNLHKDETISIRENGLFFTLHNDRDIVSLLDEAIALLEGAENIFRIKNKKSTRTSNIPDSLKPILPLSKRWSISDDDEREQLIQKTGEKQKKKLISTVDPFLNDINKFLDSFKDQPLSEEAILLGNLAELVSELKLSNS